MSAPESSQTEKTVAQVAREFQFTRNPRLGALINYYPWLLLGVFAFDLIVFGKIAEASWTQPARYSSYTALVIAAIFYYLLARLTPKKLTVLWERDALRASAAEFIAFLAETQAQLNHRASKLLSLVATIIGLLVFFALPDLPEHSLQAYARLFLFRAPFVFLSWYLIGAVVWRLFAVGQLIDQLPRRFTFNVQRTHPDQCGGLAPLGELSASNAIVLLAPGVYMVGGFLFFGNDPKTVLLLIIGVIFEAVALTAIFVVPLLAVRNEMLRQRELHYLEFAKLAHGVEENARVLFSASQLPTGAEIQNHFQIVQGLRQLNQENRDFPTLPFRAAGIALRLTAPQALTLLTGVGVERFIPSWVTTFISMLGK
ncbi:MAG: hypothetical protein HY070_06810 [Chloroflexi bacterium]|nr:hypothetical protein [Chloroflexota bacterium]